MLARGVGPGNRGLVAQVEGRRVVAAGWGAAVLVDCALHLLQDLVNLLEVALGSQIWHGWQVVVLVHCAVCRVAATDGWESGCGSHVLGTEPTGVNRQGSVERHQRPSNVGVVGRVEAPPLGVSKEIIQIFIAAPAVIRAGSAVAQGLGAVVGDGLPVVSKRAVGLGSPVSIVAMRGWLTKRGGVSTHLMAVVIIEAGRSYRGRLASRISRRGKQRWDNCTFSRTTVGWVHTAMLILGRPDQDAVVGVGLNVLLEILRTLEGLSAEVALVWLQGDVDTNVRGDVVALHRCGAARVPLASQVEVVGALPSNVPLTDVVLIRGLAKEERLGMHLQGFISGRNTIPECNITGQRQARLRLLVGFIHPIVGRLDFNSHRVFRQC